uniref:Agouti-related protein n=1 Tax=Bubo bubo TaxID=30461 RepID=A0A8C0EBB2_BUBBB
MQEVSRVSTTSCCSCLFPGLLPATLQTCPYGRARKHGSRAGGWSVREKAGLGEGGWARSREVSGHESSFLYLAGALPRLGFEQMALEVQEANGDLVQRGGALEPQASSTELQAAGREERSPRRCVRLLESCLGHQVPCCDPCATCYCRFFNAFCYCRKISTSFPCGKN